MIPSDRAALYTMKPTLKLVSQTGIVPVTHKADSAGPMTKSVEDLADLLDVLVDPTQTTIPEGGYRAAVTRDWGNVRIGILEPEKWLLPEKIVKLEKEAHEQQVSQDVVLKSNMRSFLMTSDTRVAKRGRKTQDSRQSRQECPLDITR